MVTEDEAQKSILRSVPNDPMEGAVIGEGGVGEKEEEEEEELSHNAHIATHKGTLKKLVGRLSDSQLISRERNRKCLKSNC